MGAGITRRNRRALGLFDPEDQEYIVRVRCGSLDDILDALIFARQNGIKAIVYVDEKLATKMAIKKLG